MPKLHSLDVDWSKAYKRVQGNLSKQLETYIELSEDNVQPTLRALHGEQQLSSSLPSL